MVAASAVAGVDPAPIGHNGGPPLEHRPPWGEHLGTFFAWRAAYRKQRAPVSRAAMEIRLRNAAALGLTYDEYAREIAERGRHLHAEDADRVAEIKAARGRPAAGSPREPSATSGALPGKDLRRRSGRPEPGGN
ncbi:hypothetical protein [Acuticoccus sediminis]|uniref:hypothetical protein n=1 Tax=Acuticoccus sediminis TaxID=2184697 RepID=UPI001CFEC656|nr:hypothetical protein [Acuticoccus sediminis]